MRKVLQRNAFRTLKQLKQVVFRTWRMDTVATITAKIRKQRSRGLICRALVRLGVRRRTNEIFITWRKIANSSKQQRVLAENQNAFKQESKQKKDEMKQTMQLFEQERTQYKEEINELKGLLEVRKYFMYEHPESLLVEALVWGQVSTITATTANPTTTTTPTIS